MSNTQPLHDQDAIKKFKELITHSSICHFLTSLDQRPIPSRPMSAQLVDDDGCFWFLSSLTSLKDEQITEDPYVQLLFANASAAEFLSVFGTATIVMDMAKKRELWSELAKAWFPNGVDDPDLTVLKVKPMESYYWDTKNGKVITLLKIAASAIIGKKSHSGVQGKISV